MNHDGVCQTMACVQRGASHTYSDYFSAV